jgi:serine/threonine protein kinase
VWIARFHDPEVENVQYVAVKMAVSKEKEADLRQEFEAMRAIGKHEHLIEYKEYAQNFQSPLRNVDVDVTSYLALEIAINKNLFDYLVASKDYLSEKWTRFWFKQILQGLYHINQQGYSHLDIKIDNILLDRELKIKIADFGFTKINANGISRDVGSEIYRGPEIVYGHFPYDGEKADVFALAIVLFAM